MDESSYLAYSTDAYQERYAELDEGMWLVNQILPLGGQAVLYGNPKLGKSYLALQLAAAVAGEAETWMGYSVEQHGRVLYLQLDTSGRLWCSEHIAVMAKAGFAMTSVYHSDKTTLPYPFNILSDVGHDTLKRLIDDLEPILVIVDTLREAQDGDEDKSGSMMRANQRFISAAGEAALVFLGHSRKALEDEPTRTALRGSTYLIGKMDTVVQCRKDALCISGRAIADTVLRTRRTPYLWEVLPEKAKGPSERQKALEMSRITGLSLSTCQNRLRALRLGAALLPTHPSLIEEGVGK